MLLLATDKGEANMDNKTGGRVAGSTACSETYEIAVTDPHYIIATPDWTAEGYGCGFALNEKGNKNYDSRKMIQIFFRVSLFAIVYFGRQHYTETKERNT